MRVAKWGVNRMPLIGRAWKANANVWKRHLTLQSIFNRGECMMHVDKNADGHVLDVDQISREIAYIPLNGRIRSKRSSCMQPFSSTFFSFFFWKKKRKNRKKKWVQNMLTSGLMDLNFWTCFAEVRWIWNLDMLPRGPMDLKFGHASQKSDGLILDVLPRGPMVWSLDVLLRDPMDLKFGHASQRSDGLKFGRAFQRSDGFEIWTCFPEVRWFEVWTCFPEIQWIWSFGRAS